MKQDDDGTLDENWKRLVDIERKCDFNSITAEEIITYRFAASSKDKKARDKFMKGPLKILLVLETIELDNYNRKYETKNREKNAEKTQQTVHRETNRSDIPTKHENENQLLTRREKFQTGIVAFAENRIGNWNRYVRHGGHNATTAKRWDNSPRCANPRPSTG